MTTTRELYLYEPDPTAPPPLNGWVLAWQAGAERVVLPCQSHEFALGALTVLQSLSAAQRAKLHPANGFGAPRK